MLNVSSIKEKARALFSEAEFISHIDSQEEYENALTLMDALIEDYDNNRALIETLSHAIGQWEEGADEFAEFNQRVSSLRDVDVLRLIIDQHGLSLDDLPEIGSKSLVSKILNGRGRNLTKAHIDALSKRFGLSPAVFF
ncbi:Predicted transcription regulator containing HTH domain [gamma proteobacterium HdN1]|nr:Predicted transcription regulator containing HTH domain [gamma proteobacterium HdN1]